MIAGFIGALVATVLLFSFGRPWIGDDTGDDAESAQKENNTRERVYAYFDEQDIPYETIDSLATKFTYNDISYIFLYDSIADDEIMYIWTYIPYGDNLSEKELIEKMNIALYTQVYLKFIKVNMDEDNNLFKYSIEQYIEPNMDINTLLNRMIGALNEGVSLYYYNGDDNLLLTGNSDSTQL